MKVEFRPYKARRILNRHKHADHWFWCAYSADPYIGCQHGCQFCYCREKKYCPYDDPADFSRIIKVKENAPELLRRELGRVRVDVVSTGNYQSAEHKFELSRRMLEVIHELGFPVWVLERSPLVLRDLELIEAINRRATAAVLFSAISAPGAPSYDDVCHVERLAPRAEKRFAAMEKIAQAGVLTGLAMMPILPGISDDDETLETVIEATREHGGAFVLAGGLTLADQQRDHWLAFVAEKYPHLAALYHRLYGGGKSYSPPDSYWRRLARKVAELCDKHGISDRMPRPVIPGDKLETNKRVAEHLANESYRLEIDGGKGYRVWAYRKAAWAMDDLEQDVRLVYERMGLKGLQSIKGVGESLAKVIAGQIEASRPQGRGLGVSPGRYSRWAKVSRPSPLQHRTSASSVEPSGDLGYHG